MNLHAIAASCVGAVNPPVACVVKVSTGYTIGPDGTQNPVYEVYTGVFAQVQPLTSGDLRHLDALNITGIARKFYLTGNVEGIDRQAKKGGDLIQMPSLPNFPGPTTWLIVQVMEWWQEWCCVAGTLQNGG